ALRVRAHRARGRLRPERLSGRRELARTRRTATRVHERPRPVSGERFGGRRTISLRLSPLGQLLEGREVGTVLDRIGLVVACTRLATTKPGERNDAGRNPAELGDLVPEH